MQKNISEALIGIAQQILKLLLGIFALIEKIQDWWSKRTFMQKKNIRNNFQKTFLIITNILIPYYVADYYLGVIHRNNGVYDKCVVECNTCKREKLESLNSKVEELETYKKEYDSIKIVFEVYKEKLKERL